MNNSFVAFYVVLSLFLACVDLYFARKAFKRTGPTGRYLGFSALLAALIDVSYLCSVTTTSRLNASIASSVYFCAIDWLLVCLTHFSILYTGTERQKGNTLIRMLIRVYAIFDTAVLIVNIFSEVAISYKYRGTIVAPYVYEMKPLYIAHLLFTYTLVVVTLFILISKSVRTPRQYRNPYVFITLAIFFVVIFNAVFLYPTGKSIYTLVDYSIIGYSLGLYLMYWGAFQYRENDMMKSLSMVIFSNIDQGIVLFDYNDEMIMHNKKAEQLLSGVTLRDKMPAKEFLDKCDIPSNVHEDDTYSIQSYRESNHTTLRCDCRRLRGEDGKAMIGNLFVFSDATNDSDLLTGFINWEQFRKFRAQTPWNFDHLTSVVIFDIIGLGEVNRTYGHEVGDQRIRNLVKIMRGVMPADTYFVRGYEAHLVAICYHKTEQELQVYVDDILAACGDRVAYGMGSTYDDLSDTLAGDRTDPDSRNVMRAIDRASRSMHIKKLMDASSRHSQALTSLVRALQESDSDTEAHVKRTQKMGATLGHRIGLNDLQQSELSLLCLLHDIGKIGIPLEILNKPGKLSQEEWKVLRSHAEKGYQIAMSSEELKAIAPMILSHHERWDGNGYPQGLVGENIPILSRVISIVDAYDAMVNNRSYRKALKPEEAQEEIRRCSGTQFDPALASEFLQMLEENPEIAAGERTGGEEIRGPEVFRAAKEETVDSGNTCAVHYSRYLLDLDDYIIEVDDVFEELTGYSREDIAGRRMKQNELIPPKERTGYWMQVTEQFGKGSSVYLKHDIMKKDGSITRVYCNGRQYFDSAVKEFRSEIIIFQADRNSNQQQ